MEIVSLIIMVIGLVALVVIYVISRISRKDMPEIRKLPPIATLRGEDGEEVTSVGADQPATDGKIPRPDAPTMDGVIGTTTKPPDPIPSQLIMFIASESEDGFVGEEVLTALESSDLIFGEMNVFHRIVLTNDGEKSLFYVANGVKPWTLVPDELQVSSTPGLSMILNLPSPAGDMEAIHDFVRTAEQINDYLGGVLQNQKQEPITDEQRRAYFAMG